MTDKPTWLMKLSKEVFKIGIKYFDHEYAIEKIWNPKDMQKSMKASFKKYGTPFAESWFKPHITLAVFNDKRTMDKAVSKIKIKNFSFVVAGLALCALGENKSCQNIIKNFAFKKIIGARERRFSVMVAMAIVDRGPRRELPER